MTDSYRVDRIPTIFLSLVDIKLKEINLNLFQNSNYIVIKRFFLNVEIVQIVLIKIICISISKVQLSHKKFS